MNPAHDHPLPAPAFHLEEASARAPGDVAAATAFALWRATAQDDARPIALIAPRHWLAERGRLFAAGAAHLGLPAQRLVLITADKETAILWALEEALKSGAMAGAVGAVRAPDFVATRRLDFAAKAGRACAVLLRAGPAADLSSARLRWRIATSPSAAHPFDARAPGAARIAIDLVRSRLGALGTWILEQDDETGCFRLAAGLADHGLVQSGQTSAA